MKNISSKPSGLGIGLIQIYTGNGKGKTTAALGLSMRAAGWGMRVLFVQFLKPVSTPSGEMKSAQELGISIRRLSDDSFINGISEELRKKTCTLIRDEIKNIQQEMKRDAFDIYVMDELITAVSLGIFPEEEVLALMEAKPKNAELILTGRGASKELIEYADLVSEIRPIKHPYEKKIPSRQGIEF